jgi:hypothetical protein
MVPEGLREIGYHALRALLLIEQWAFARAPATSAARPARGAAQKHARRRAARRSWFLGLGATGYVFIAL